MTALTFETIAHDGVIDLPAGQLGLNGKPIKVIVMDDTNGYEAAQKDLQDIAAAYAMQGRIDAGGGKTYPIDEIEARPNAMDS
jgi:hypothetical protein